MTVFRGTDDFNKQQLAQYVYGGMPRHTLASEPKSIAIQNQLQVPVMRQMVRTIDPMSYDSPYSIAQPNSTGTFPYKEWAAYGLRSEWSSSVIGVLRSQPGHELSAYGGTMTLNAHDTLTMPGDIGLPSLHNVLSSMAPPSFPWVLVGVAPVKDKSGLIIEISQSWQPTDAVLILEAGQSQSQTLTQKTGVLSSTTKQEEFSATLGTKASGGWGPISAEISASMTTTSRVSETFEFTDETTSSITQDRTAEGCKTGWYPFELQERIQVFNASGSLQAEMTRDILETVAIVRWQGAAQLVSTEVAGHIDDQLPTLEWEQLERMGA